MEKYELYCKSLQPLVDYVYRLEANDFFRSGSVLSFSFTSFHHLKSEWKISWDSHEAKYQLLEVQSGLHSYGYFDTLEAIIIRLDTFYVSDLEYK